MMKQTFVLPHGWDSLLEWIEQESLKAPDRRKKLRVTIEPYRKKRSLPQNSFLHGVSLKLISDHTGYELEDIKTLLLGKAFGWEEYEVLGERRRRPIKRSSDMNTEQMAWWLEWIERWAAQELDIIIPKPNEVIE